MLMVSHTFNKKKQLKINEVSISLLFLALNFASGYLIVEISQMFYSYAQFNRPICYRKKSRNFVVVVKQSLI